MTEKGRIWPVPYCPASTPNTILLFEDQEDATVQKFSI